VILFTIFLQIIHCKSQILYIFTLNKNLLSCHLNMNLHSKIHNLCVLFKIIFILNNPNMYIYIFHFSPYFNLHYCYFQKIRNF